MSGVTVCSVGDMVGDPTESDRRDPLAGRSVLCGEAGVATLALASDGRREDDEVDAADVITC
jgi:hypothetical protein